MSSRHDNLYKEKCYIKNKFVCKIQSLMLSHLILLSTDFFSKTNSSNENYKNIKILNIFARREMIEALMTFGILYIRINITYTHVLRGCGKVLADQLNFHDGGETRHYGATYHDKRGRDGLGYCYV